MAADLELNPDEAIVRGFFATVLSGARDLASLDRFIAADFVDHTAEGDDRGPSGVLTKLEQLWTALPEGRYELLDVAGSGGLVAVRSRLVGGRRPVAFADFYRVREGRISEHWHVVDAGELAAALS